MAEKRIVEVSQIEVELDNVWEALESSEKTKAALFNLIVYVPDREHLNYVRRASKRILDKFPSRILFLLEDPDPKHDFLQVEVSIETFSSSGAMISCDQIDIEFAGQHRERVPFIVLPHLLPDLPVHWLCIGDPQKDSAIFKALKPCISTLIVDPDSLHDMDHWGAYLLSLDTTISDLKWAALDGWRRVIQAAFRTEDHLQRLLHARAIRIGYTTRSSEFLRDARLQAAYIQGWIASALGWQFLTADGTEQQTLLSYASAPGGVKVSLVSHQDSRMPFGTVTAIDIDGYDGSQTQLSLDRSGEQVRVEASTPQQCDLPYAAYIEHPMHDRALTRELFRPETSTHYLKTVKLLSTIPWINP